MKTETVSLPNSILVDLKGVLRRISNEKILHDPLADQPDISGLCSPRLACDSRGHEGML